MSAIARSQTQSRNSRISLRPSRSIGTPLPQDPHLVSVVEHSACVPGEELRERRYHWATDLRVADICWLHSHRHSPQCQLLAVGSVACSCGLPRPVRGVGGEEFGRSRRLGSFKDSLEKEHTLRSVDNNDVALNLGHRPPSPTRPCVSVCLVETANWTRLSTSATPVSVSCQLQSARGT